MPGSQLCSRGERFSRSCDSLTGDGGACMLLSFQGHLVEMSRNKAVSAPPTLYQNMTARDAKS